MKKTVTRVLSLALCLAVLSGCTAKTASTEAPATTAGTEAASAEDKPEAGKEEGPAPAAGETKTIIDQGGNEVVIPVDIKRVAIASLWPLPSVYVLYQGSGAKLVGMHPASKCAAEYSLLMTVAPELKDVDTSFIQGGEVNVEELIKLKPDVIFCNANNAKEREVL